MQTAEIDRQIKAITTQRDKLREDARKMRDDRLRDSMESQADELDSDIKDLHEKRREAVGAAITRAMSK